MKKIDCLGDMCPMPLLRIKKELEVVNAGSSILVVTDHSCAKQNVADFCKKNQLHCEIEEVITGVWEIIVFKT